jgi:hypothetical protein
MKKKTIISKPAKKMRIKKIVQTGKPKTVMGYASGA